MIGQSNVQPLADRGFPFYAVNARYANAVKRINVGDGLLLYQSVRGIIGVFEISGEPFESSERIFPGIKSYPIRIPLRKLSLLVDRPLNLRPFMGKLQFLPVSENIGSYLQTTLRQISEADFKLLVRAAKSLNTSATSL